MTNQEAIKFMSKVARMVANGKITDFTLGEVYTIQSVQHECIYINERYGKSSFITYAEIIKRGDFIG